MWRRYFSWIEESRSRRQEGAISEHSAIHGGIHLDASKCSLSIHFPNLAFFFGSKSNTIFLSSLFTLTSVPILLFFSLFPFLSPMWLAPSLCKPLKLNLFSDYFSSLSLSFSWVGLLLSHRKIIRLVFSASLSLSKAVLKYTNFGGVSVLNSPWSLTELLSTEVLIFFFFLVLVMILSGTRSLLVPQVVVILISLLLFSDPDLRFTHPLLLLL